MDMTDVSGLDDQIQTLFAASLPEAVGYVIQIHANAVVVTKPCLRADTYPLNLKSSTYFHNIYVLISIFQKVQDGFHQKENKSALLHYLINSYLSR